ncbi:aldolase [uncultured Methanoregula sp.]|uniref:aldolase n=1 Tax=uncultured Methanoregula sp. TaxID=1005933 RepID=UPI002AAAB297|nr:aldolase [uncultured Methanoregula sp.]
MYSGEFERIGKRLFSEHLVGGNFGNISVRNSDDGFLIKRTGAYLDVATEPVFVPLVGEAPREASSEYRVHREVYRKTPYRAIVHAHPPVAIAASLVLDRIVPEDSEGQMLCPVIPVVTGSPGSQEIADNVTAALIRSKLVMVRGHGSFAAGNSLDEAYLYTSLVEHSCRIIALKKGFS